MFKWVVGLCAGIYLVLMLFGEPTAEELAAREARDLQQVTRADTTELVAAPAPEPEAAPVTTEVDTAPLVIESPALVSATAATPAIPEPAVAQTAIPAADPATVPPSNPIWRVTANAVNLRAGPSTNTSVVGRATRNDNAEVIELLPSGWAKVYVLETGTEAYMSAQFLQAPE